MVACKGLYSKAGKQQLMKEGMLYIASRVAADPLMRHGKRLFAAPPQQTHLSGLCIRGCIVGMCLRRSSFKAKHQANFLFRMRRSPYLTAHTYTHTLAYKTTPTEQGTQALT